MNWRANRLVRLPSLSRVAVAIGACLLLLGNAPVDAKTKKSKTTPTPTPSASPASDKSIMEVPIPIGYDAKVVRIPVLSTEGKLQMLFDSEIAFRVDARQLRLTQLKIETYDDAGKSEMFIHMPLSIFNLETRILSSTDPVTIRRTDFEITGGNMTFDTQTREGKFTGPVRMLIFNLNNEVEQPKENASRE